MLGLSVITNNQASPVVLFAATVQNAAGGGEGESVTVNVGGEVAACRTNLATVVCRRTALMSSTR
jgi:hypothetical protein